MPIIALAPLLLAAAAGQNVTSRPTILSPSDQRGQPGMPAPTMVVEPIAMALAAWDTNGDGKTTKAEMFTGVVDSFAHIESRPATPLGYIGYSDWAERYLGDRNALPSPFEVDTDGDNKISLAELQAAVERAFDRLDHNHDGVLTRAELLTIRSGVRGEGPGRDGRRPPR